MRVKDFQLLSLRLVCSSILHATPYYTPVSLDCSGSHSGSLGLPRRNLPRGASRGQGLDRTGSGKANLGSVEELAGLYVHGELLALGLTFEEHLSQVHTTPTCILILSPYPTPTPNFSCRRNLAQPVPLIFSPQNPGAYAFGKEMVRAIAGITLVAQADSGLRDDAEEGEEEQMGFPPGERVVHARHGLGVVVGHYNPCSGCAPSPLLHPFIGGWAHHRRSTQCSL